jgi:hypothetical protein
MWKQLTGEPVAICGVGSNVVLRGRDEVRQRCMPVEGHIN